MTFANLLEFHIKNLSGYDFVLPTHTLYKIHAKNARKVERLGRLSTIQGRIRGPKLLIGTCDVSEPRDSLF